MTISLPSQTLGESLRLSSNLGPLYREFRITLHEEISHLLPAFTISERPGDDAFLDWGERQAPFSSV